MNHIPHEPLQFLNRTLGGLAEFAAKFLSRETKIRAVEGQIVCPRRQGTVQCCIFTHKDVTTGIQFLQVLLRAWRPSVFARIWPSISWRHCIQEKHTKHHESVLCPVPMLGHQQVPGSKSGLWRWSPISWNACDGEQLEMSFP